MCLNGGVVNTVLLQNLLPKWMRLKESANRVVNGFLKVTACVYRPWIRDARIVPDSAALAEATGYSFPSGHSMNGASLYGGGAIRKELPRARRIVLGVIVALIAAALAVVITLICINRSRKNAWYDSADAVEKDERHD